MAKKNKRKRKDGQESNRDQRSSDTGATKKAKRWKLLWGEVIELGRKLESLAFEVSKTKEKISEIQESTTSLTGRFESIRNDVATNANRILTLTQAEDKFESLAAELKSVQENLEREKQRNGVSKIRKMADDLEWNSERIRLLESRLSETSQAIGSLTRATEETGKRIQDSEKSLREVSLAMQREIHARDQTVELFQKTLNDVNSKFDVSSNDDRTQLLENEIVRWNSRIDGIANEISSTNLKLDIFGKKLDETMTLLSTIQDKIGNDTLRIESLEAARDDISKRIDATENKSSSVPNRIEALEKEIFLRPRSISNGPIKTRELEKDPSPPEEAFKDDDEKL